MCCTLASLTEPPTGAPAPGAVALSHAWLLATTSSETQFASPEGLQELPRSWVRRGEPGPCRAADSHSLGPSLWASAPCAGEHRCIWFFSPVSRNHGLTTPSACTQRKPSCPTGAMATQSSWPHQSPLYAGMATPGIQRGQPRWPPRAWGACARPHSTRRADGPHRTATAHTGQQTTHTRQQTAHVGQQAPTGSGVPASPEMSSKQAVANDSLHHGVMK